MACERIAVPGGFAVVCDGRRGRRHRCVKCAGPVTLQCDGPRASGKRDCDAYICAEHSRRYLVELDFCPTCTALWLFWWAKRGGEVVPDAERRARFREWRQRLTQAHVTFIEAHP